MKTRTGVRARRSGVATGTYFPQCPLTQRPLGSIEPPFSQTVEELVVAGWLPQRPLGSAEAPLSQSPAELLVAGWLPSTPKGSILPPFLFKKPVRTPRNCPKTPRTSWAIEGPDRWARLRSSEAEAHGVRRINPKTRAITTRRNDRLDMTAAPFGEAASATAFRAGPAPHRKYGAA